MKKKRRMKSVAKRKRPRRHFTVRHYWDT